MPLGEIFIYIRCIGRLKPNENRRRQRSKRSPEEKRHPKTISAVRYSPPIDSMLASCPSGTADELYISISSSPNRSPPNRSDDAETAVASMAGHPFEVMIRLETFLLVQFALDLAYLMLRFDPVEIRYYMSLQYVFFPRDLLCFLLLGT